MFDDIAAFSDASRRRRQHAVIAASGLSHGLAICLTAALLVSPALPALTAGPEAPQPARLTFVSLPPRPPSLSPSTPGVRAPLTTWSADSPVDTYVDLREAPDNEDDGVMAGRPHDEPPVYGVEGGIHGCMTGGLAWAPTDGLQSLTRVPIDFFLPSRPMRAGHGAPIPVKVVDVRPTYPPLARSARIQGVVLLDATIDDTGHVVDVRVLRSIPLLDSSAVAAVRRWRYAPATLNGRPIPVVLTVDARFTL